MSYLILFTLLAGASFFIWHRLSNQETMSGKIPKDKDALIIFDFDGTLCSSYHLFINELNALSPIYKHRKIENHERELLGDLDAKQVIQFLNISSWRLPFLIKKLKKNVQSSILKVPPIEGLQTLIQQLKARGFAIGILTSNSQENVGSWLKVHNMDLFDFIYSANNLFGKKKCLKAIIKDLSNPLVYYVGDEVRDMKAAKDAELKAIAVTWGYNSKKILAASKPDYLCEDPQELASFFMYSCELKNRVF